MVYKETKQTKKQEELMKKEEDLNMIIFSLNKSYLKEKIKPFVVDKSILLFKIVDKYGISPQKAKEYLSILQSRGFIQIEKEVVYYYSEKHEEYLKKVIENIK